MNPNIEPNIEPNMEPNIELDIEPNIEPNIECNIEPNIEPNTEHFFTDQKKFIQPPLNVPQETNLSLHTVFMLTGFSVAEKSQISNGGG